MNKRDYKHYLKSNHWKDFKIRYFKRHKRVCSRCKRTKRIELHHLNYAHLFHEAFRDVMPLCNKCHAKLHNKQKKKSKIKINKTEVRKCSWYSVRPHKTAKAVLHNCSNSSPNKSYLP